MKSTIKHIVILIILLFQLNSYAIEVERFELLNTTDGLSQSSVQSSFCDSRGYLWFGTMDGLNRYDGYSFHVYLYNPDDKYSLSNNRIVKIWEDSDNFIWVESHDGHYHYLDITTDRFYSFPNSKDINNNVNVRITSFLEVNGNEIWLGTDNAGVYHLILNDNGIYDYKHFSALDINSISNDNINFIISDKDSNVWIGTANGVNLVQKRPDSSDGYIFQHFLIDHTFTCAVSLNDKIWFGTSNKEFISYNLKTELFETEKLISKETQITTLQKTKSGNLIIGTQNSGLKIYNPILDQSFSYFEGQYIKRIYEDRQGILWLVTNKPGISRLNLNSSVEQHFLLASEEIEYLVTDERQVFFEDVEGNMWIGSNGGGLALYATEKSSLKFFRNDPENDFSLSSDAVSSITQDKSGLIWIGTGQPDGGINKIISPNPLFIHLQLKKNIDNRIDNLVKAIFQDSKNNVWVTTKSGNIHIYNQSFELITEFDHLRSLHSNFPKSNTYTIMQDNEGFIWLGSKGGGIAVSRYPLEEYNNYDDIKFNTYLHEPKDGSSLSNDYVYSIIQDKDGAIWIGTYGGGVNIVQNRTASKLKCIHYNTENSNLSSNLIRQVFQDKNERIWIATTYGLNLLEKSSVRDSATFVTFTHNRSNTNSLSYNDIVYIYEDSKERLWFGTFGGGVNYFRDAENHLSGFNHLTTENGLINNAVFGIAGDDLGNIWFSTQNGISRHNPEENKFDNFDINNGLVCSDFTENSSAILNTGKIIFGNTSGILIITPDEVTSKQFSPPICFTNFLLFNKEVDINDEKSPLSKNINYTDRIVLKHNQSSFSFEYAALSYFGPKKNHYSYTLENFDDAWYNVKNERKATYTNIPPGEYTFKVKASNWDGTRSDDTREIKIKILRPWWGTNLALICYLILSIILFEFLRRVYSNYSNLQTDLKVEKRVNEIKLQFFTNISHEIRTPLTLILGPLEDLKKIPNLPSLVNTPVNIINRNGKRILRLVNQLLDFRKIQNQKMKLKVQEVEISRFAYEVCQNFENLALEKNIRFTFPEPDEEIYSWIDKEKIDSVLFNILANAFKFTKSGKSINLTVKQDHDFLTIAIKDEGKGIPKDKLPLLFKRFSTLSADDIDFSGTGIGLAYSYELIKLHNGEINVESIYGEGSTFTVSIPTGKNHFSPENTVFIEKQTLRNYSHVNEYELENLSETTPLKEENASQKYKIVIVEDNIEVINYVESILNKSFDTFHAYNGIEGLKKIHEIHPDLVITDLMMPEMDGLTMTKKIKEDFSISHIPVVMLTAKSTMDDRIQGIETGAEAYILKPFNSNHLTSIVDNLLKQRQIITKKLHYESFSTEVKITNKDEEFIKNTVNIIESNCQDQDFNVNELIVKSNMGRTAFYNKIKGLTGLAPVDFVRKIKLQIAKKQIKENNCGVSEAAYLAGFNDVKYFTKCFKKTFGMNPREYKKGEHLVFKNSNN
jgi:signal transduction histidine kinase/ligand-binding sensor domain-containing protein/DNA-binding response OmpR family regulator